MKVLVVSDSHNTLSYMERCVEAIRPDAVIHLGDYVSDGRLLASQYPEIPFYQVPGNCDAYRCEPDMISTIVVNLGGVSMMLTHGHRQYVKSGTERLLSEARRSRVGAVLYGHTHIPDCRQEEDGLWVLNPGSAGFFRPTAGWMIIENGAIQICRILREQDLEEAE